VLAVPNLMPLAVEHLVPTPTETKMFRKRDSLRRDMREKESKDYSTELSESEKYRDQKHQFQLWFEYRAMLRREAFKRFGALSTFQSNRIRHQVRVNQAVSRVSPSAAFVYAATNCAGTGARDYLDFVSQLETFRRAHLDAKVDEEMVNIDDSFGENVDFWSQRFGIHRLPLPQWRERPLTAALNESWLDVVLLVGAAALLFMISFIGFMRYDPR
jgi:uncharacterized protein DUF3526